MTRWAQDLAWSILAVIFCGVVISALMVSSGVGVALSIAVGATVITAFAITAD